MYHSKDNEAPTKDNIKLIIIIEKNIQ